MAAKKRDSRCKGVTKSGKPCRAWATESGLCFLHANPDKASELGRIGGRTNRHRVVEAGATLPKSNTGIAVQETIDRVIEDVYSGKLDPRSAAAICQLLNMRARVVQTAPVLLTRGNFPSCFASPAPKPEPKTREPNPEASEPNHDPKSNELEEKLSKINGMPFSPEVAEAIKACIRQNGLKPDKS
jgi:hypothetical protein